MAATPPDSESACPVCAATTTLELLYQPRVPVHQHALYSTPAMARSAPQGTLALRLCPNCDFVFNVAFDPKLLDYGSNYDNSQTYSSTFVQHVDCLIDHLVADPAFQNARIAEVGCGKGTFLQRLVERVGGTTTGTGYDPTYVGPDETCAGRVRYVRANYDRDSAQSADAVVCRHVIEHVPRPLELLRTMRDTLRDAPQPRIYLETPSIDWILRHHVVWDLFYEHCSLFTARSLSWAFIREGFSVREVKHVFGDQYLWLEATTGTNRPQPKFKPQLDRLATEFVGQWAQMLAQWRSLLQQYRSRGPVFVWGAGAKGVTFCNLADAGQQWLHGIIDINPAKQGKFLAGTGHAIVGPTELRNSRNCTILVLNPNYFGEVIQHTQSLGLQGYVIDLMNGQKVAA